MTDEDPIDYHAIRRRFPWFGLASIDEPNLSTRYREIMASTRPDRTFDSMDEMFDEIDAAQRDEAQ